MGARAAGQCIQIMSNNRDWPKASVLWAMLRLKPLAKGMYDLMPFKREIFTLVRGVAHVPERIHKHLHFKGVITVPVGPGERFRIMHHGHLIENELFWEGTRGWEKVSLELWTRLCKRSSVILDIGANTGVYALVAKAVNPQARVAAVEPVGRVFRKLEQNIALNGWDIRAFHAAASDHTGKAVLFDTPAREHVLSVSLEADWNSDSPELRPVEVDCITVADMLARIGAPAVDLLKIDVETHEPAVLAGFREILQRDRPAMLIELLNDDVARQVSSQVEGLGYAFFNIDEVAWPPHRVDSLSKSGHFNFLLCRPETAASIGL